MRHNESARFAEILVSARMIEMPVGVDEEFDWTRAQCGDCRLNLGGQRRKLIINDHRSIGTV